MDTPLRLLILEDNATDTGLMLQALCRAGFHPIVEPVKTEQDFRDRLHSAPDVILAAGKRPRFSASDAWKILRESGRDIPFIVVSGSVDEEQAVAVLEQGAADSVMKASPGCLGQAVRQAMEKKRPRDGVRMAAAFQHYDSDLEFLHELAGMMEGIAPRLVAEIRDAVDEQDATKLEHAAHRLKGSLIPFVAPAAMDAAQSLETMGHVDDLSSAWEAYRVLDVDVQRLLAALKEVTSFEALATQAQH